MISSEMKRALRKARSNSGDSLTRMMRAPASVAVCLICAKLCVAAEIEAGDALEIEDQKVALPLLRQQRLDVLIEPVGGAEEQVALQRHALDFAPVRRQQSKLVRPAIEGRAVFRAVEAELDGVHAADAQCKRGAADDDAGEHAGDKAPVDNQKRDGDERQIVEELQLAGRLDQPLIDEAGAQEEQQAAENVFRHVTDEAWAGDQ